MQGLECLILTGCSLSRAGLRRMLGSRFLGRTLQWLDISECGAALKELHCNPRVSSPPGPALSDCLIVPQGRALEVCDILYPWP